MTDVLGFSAIECLHVHVALREKYVCLTLETSHKFWCDSKLFWLVSKHFAFFDWVCLVFRFITISNIFVHSNKMGIYLIGHLLTIST